MLQMAVTRGRQVPLARRQLTHEPLKLVLALAGVVLSVALVGLLLGLREGITRQVTTYEDNTDAEVYVASGDTQNFLGSGPASLTASVGRRLRRIQGVAEAAPITTSLGILALHDKRIATLLVGSQPGRAGGPWKMAEGRVPRAAGEVALDRVMAGAHDLGPGDTVRVRGRPLKVVGLTDRTASWMTPLIFTTWRTANMLQRQGDSASFFLVRARGLTAAALRGRIARRLPKLSVLTRAQISANDRALMAKVFNAPLLIMVVIALAVGALVIGLTLYGFVSERRREFGSLKAIGERNGRLYRLVSLQALAIAFAGLAGGVVLQQAASSAIEELWPKFLFVSLGTHFVLMLSAAVAMAVAGALVPVRVLARLDPMEVFRR